MHHHGRWHLRDRQSPQCSATAGGSSADPRKRVESSGSPQHQRSSDSAISAQGAPLQRLQQIWRRSAQPRPFANLASHPLIDLRPPTSQCLLVFGSPCRPSIIRYAPSLALPSFTKATRQPSSAHTASIVARSGTHCLSREIVANTGQKIL